MIEPRVLCPDRLRRVPEKFSWLDHRLVQDRYLQRCQPHAWALYLLLVTVGDAHGISWYATATMAVLLNVPVDTVIDARQQLMRCGMIAFEKPFYQVLALDRWTITLQEDRPLLSDNCPSPEGITAIRNIIRQLKEMP